MTNTPSIQNTPKGDPIQREALNIKVIEIPFPPKTERPNTVLIDGQTIQNEDELEHIADRIRSRYVMYQANNLMNEPDFQRNETKKKRELEEIDNTTQFRLKMLPSKIGIKNNQGELQLVEYPEGKTQSHVYLVESWPTYIKERIIATRSGKTIHLEEHSRYGNPLDAAKFAKPLSKILDSLDTETEILSGGKPIARIQKKDPNNGGHNTKLSNEGAVLFYFNKDETDQFELLLYLPEKYVRDPQLKQSLEEKGVLNTQYKKEAFEILVQLERIAAGIETAPVK